MHIEKSVDSPWGVPITYWAISNVTIVFAPHHTMTITYAGWAHEEAFLAEAQPMATKDVELSTVTSDPAAQAIQADATAWLYSVLMMLPDFTEGTLVE